MIPGESIFHGNDGIIFFCTMFMAGKMKLDGSKEDFFTRRRFLELPLGVWGKRYWKLPALPGQSTGGGLGGGKNLKKSSISTLPEIADLLTFSFSGMHKVMSGNITTVQQFRSVSMLLAKTSNPRVY